MVRTVVMLWIHRVRDICDVRIIGTGWRGMHLIGRGAGIGALAAMVSPQFLES